MGLLRKGRAFVFFVFHVNTRRILLVQATFSPNGQWLKQQAQHVLWECEELEIEPRFFLHDIVRSTTYCLRSPCSFLPTYEFLYTMRSFDSNWSTNAQVYATFLTVKNPFNLPLIDVHHVLNSADLGSLICQSCYIVSFYMFYSKLPAACH